MTQYEKNAHYLEQLSDTAVKHGHIPSMTSAELDAARRLVVPVAGRYVEWAAQHPTVDVEGVFPTTLLMCVQFPHMTVEQTLTRVQACFWITAIDTYLDSPDTSPREALRLVSDCLTVALSPVGAEVAASDYSAVLLDVKRSLSAYPLFRALQPVWGATAARLLDGMMYEYWLNRDHRERPASYRLPPLEEYLYFGRATIGLPFVWVTGTILADDPSVLPILPNLLDLADCCGLAMRLANDKRTFDREDAGGEINALHILAEHATAGHRPFAFDAAARALQERMRRALEEAEGLTARIQEKSAIARQYLRSTRYGIEMYERSDYHSDYLR